MKNESSRVVPEEDASLRTNTSTRNAFPVTVLSNVATPVRPVVASSQRQSWNGEPTVGVGVGGGNGGSQFPVIVGSGQVDISWFLCCYARKDHASEKPGADGVGVGVVVLVTDGVTDGVTVLDGVTDGVTVLDGVTDGVVVLVTDGVTDGVTVAAGVDEISNILVGVGVGVLVIDGVGVFVGVCVGVCVGVGVGEHTG